MESLVTGLLIACTGFVGDVIVSAIKRDNGRKDTGTIIPGHGGILDRIDSLAISAPIFFYWVYNLYYAV
jgi:phosphatidate cytidylyltransferase